MPKPVFFDTMEECLDSKRFPSALRWINTCVFLVNMKKFNHGDVSKVDQRQVDHFVWWDELNYKAGFLDRKPNRRSKTYLKNARHRYKINLNRLVKSGEIDREPKEDQAGLLAYRKLPKGLFDLLHEDPSGNLPQDGTSPMETDDEQQLVSYELRYVIEAKTVASPQRTIYLLEDGEKRIWYTENYRDFYLSEIDISLLINAFSVAFLSEHSIDQNPSANTDESCNQSNNPVNCTEKAYDDSFGGHIQVDVIISCTTLEQGKVDADSLHTEPEKQLPTVDNCKKRFPTDDGFLANCSQSSFVADSTMQVENQIFPVDNSDASTHGVDDTTPRHRSQINNNDGGECRQGKQDGNCFQVVNAIHFCSDIQESHHGSYSDTIVQEVANEIHYSGDAQVSQHSLDAPNLATAFQQVDNEINFFGDTQVSQSNFDGQYTASNIQQVADEIHSGNDAQLLGEQTLSHDEILRAEGDTLQPNTSERSYCVALGENRWKNFEDLLFDEMLKSSILFSDDDFPEDFPDVDSLYAQVVKHDFGKEQDVIMPNQNSPLILKDLVVT